MRIDLARIVWTMGASVVLFVGCQGGSDGGAVAMSGGSAQSTAHHDHHAHPTEGPHQGHLIELGKEDYHAELVHDDDAKKVTVYLLDEHARSPVASEEPALALNLVVDGKPQQFKLLADPLDGDASGRASRYSLAAPEVVEALESSSTTGRLQVTIAGKNFTGAVKHHRH